MASMGPVAARKERAAATREAEWEADVATARCVDAEAGEEEEDETSPPPPHTTTLPGLVVQLAVLAGEWGEIGEWGGTVLPSGCDRSNTRRRR